MIRTEGLTRRFRNFTAVGSLDMEVDEGEIFGLLRTNGAGNAIIIKMLNTLLPSSVGKALVNGMDVLDDLSDVR